MKALAWILLITALALVVIVEGVANPFCYWNMLPIVLSAGSLISIGGRPRSSLSQKQRRSTACFALTTSSMIILVHFAWMFDWGGTASGSSTSAVIFVVLPLLAVFAGGCAYWIARMIPLRQKPPIQ